MYLSYDVVKLILEIKYNNWIKEKECLCGSEDYKECDIIECYACPNNYCFNQEKFEQWIWQCWDCEEYFCGFHDFRMNRNRDRFCDSCIYPDSFEITLKNKLRRLPTRKVLALHTHRTKKYGYPAPPNSPEL